MPTTQKSMKKLSRDEALQELFNLREKNANKKNRLRQLNAEHYTASDLSDNNIIGIESKPWLDEEIR